MVTLVTRYGGTEDACGVAATHDAGGRGNICVVAAPRDERGRMRGFVPARRDPFVSAKGPKTMGAQAWPFGCLCPGPEGLGCGTRFAQTVLAPTLNSGPGRSHAWRRPGFGAMGWRDCKTTRSTTTTKDERSFALLGLAAGQPLVGPPHEWVFIGCLRDVEGVISRGLARAYDRGRRVRATSGGDGGESERGICAGCTMTT